MCRVTGVSLSSAAGHGKKPAKAVLGRNSSLGADRPSPKSSDKGGMPAARHGGFPRVAHGSGNVLAVLGIRLSRGCVNGFSKAIHNTAV